VLAYYKRTLIHLFSQVQQVRANPARNAALCLTIQETLTKKITQVEGRIRRARLLAKEKAAYLRAKRSEPLSKTAARELKGEIGKHRDRIEQYRCLLRILRSVADALAFVYLDKWDIKPMAFRESSGFISGKAGARIERRCLRELFRAGHVAILNDLTNCLRYGDITVADDSRQGILIEVKASTLTNRRTNRQKACLEGLCNYLLTDKTTNLYGRTDWTVQRRSVHSQESHHRRGLNDLIRDSYAGRRHGMTPEDGLHYFVVAGQRAPSFDMEAVLEAELRDRLTTGQYAAFFISEMKYNNVAYTPYVLSIDDSQAVYDFYAGNLFIVVLADLSLLAARLASHGLLLSETDDPDLAFVIEYADSEEDWIAISRHFFHRLPCEFLSLAWFADEMVHLARIGPEELAAAGEAPAVAPPHKPSARRIGVRS